MALPSSGNLSISQIDAEFGISKPSTFPDDYQNLGGTAPANPTSIRDFLGAEAVSPLSAAASPDSVSGSRNGPGQVTSGTTNVFVSGGSGTITYAWSRVSGDSRIAATVPSGNSTAFRATLGAPDLAQATFVCTVTRNGESTTASVDVSLSSFSND